MFKVGEKVECIDSRGVEGYVRKGEIYTVLMEAGTTLYLAGIGCQDKYRFKLVSPTHYNFPIQPVDFIEQNKLGFSVGNIIKYVCRYKNKGGVEDLEKAKDYLQRLIDHETSIKS